VTNGESGYVVNVTDVWAWLGTSQKSGIVMEKRPVGALIIFVPQLSPTYSELFTNISLL